MANANKRAILQSQAENTRSWANMMNEENAKAGLIGPNSAPATYKALGYLPNAGKWAAKQETIAEEASAERAETPTPQRPENIEDIERNKRSYNRYRERMGLPPRANKTPSRERRRRDAEKNRTARRRSPSPRRSQSPRNRRRHSRSPVRRYGVGRRYVAAPGSRRERRSPSPRRSYSRRSHSRRSHSRRRSPSVNEFGRNMTRNYRRRGSRNASPVRYTIAADGRPVNEFGRNIPNRRYTQARGSRFNGSRRQRRPIHVFDEKTQSYKPAEWNV